MLACVFGLLLACAGLGSSAAQELELVNVASGFQSPVFLTHAGDARLFVVEQVGTIRVFEPGVDNVVQPPPFLDIRSRVRFGGEQGLLGLAFHPDYLQNGRFFVYYTNLQGNSVLARFENPNPQMSEAPASSEVQLLVIEQPFTNHNGGMLAFDPEGLLHVGLGDGGSGDDPLCTAQRTDTLLGKILRLDIDTGSQVAPFYSIPDSNPFVGQPGVRPEIWTLGVRNPWRFSFDRASGDLFVGDVGQRTREEISLLPRGAGGLNLGWKMLEGTLCRNQSGGCGQALPACDSGQYTPPILEYGRSEGFSVTGGYRYAGDGIPALRGDYFFGDFGSGRVWTARRSGTRWIRTERPELRASSLASFGEDAQGELYLVQLSGEILAIREASVGGPPPSVLSFSEVEVFAGEGSSGFVLLQILRTGSEESLQSAAAVTVRTNGNASTATAGLDYQAVDERLEWEAGDGGVRLVTLDIFDDDLVEGSEEVVVRLVDPLNATLDPAAQRLVITILDDDTEPMPCASGPQQLCLRGTRFSVDATWRAPDGARGGAFAQELTADTGTFHFFQPSNVELVVKVLDGCAINGAYWVFLTGLTDLEVRGSVVDTEAAPGQRRVFSFANELGQRFQPVLATDAFGSCP